MKLPVVVPVIVDTGPLVAMLVVRDQHHRWAKEVLETIEPPLLTCEAVISEACFLVSRLAGGRDAVLSLLAKGIVKTAFSLAPEIERVRRLMQRYASVPMSLADACLVRMLETHSARSILTLDGDFQIYRGNGRQILSVISP